MNKSQEALSRSIPKVPGADPVIKVCGITSVSDALLAARLGADLLGFNFYKRSPRYVNHELAASIFAELPSEVVSVGVFVNESVETVVAIAKALKLDAIQLHGDEDSKMIGELRIRTGLDVIKAILVGPDFEVDNVDGLGANAILLDSYSKSERGGTGRKFDWNLAYQVQCTGHFVYLAGGLSPDNVSQAIRQARPHGVDVCSGVESEPGKKDADKLERFIAAVRNTI